MECQNHHTEGLSGLVRRAKRLLRREFESALECYGLTHVQFRVLRSLWEQDGLSIGELGRSQCLDAATITGLVDRLEAKGLVRRCRGADDRRAVQVFLTEQGSVLRQTLKGIGATVEAKATAGMSPEDARKLNALLRQVCDNLEKEA